MKKEILFFCAVLMLGLALTSEAANDNSKNSSTEQTNPACIPATRTDWSVGRAKWLGKMKGKDNYDILFLGDSITQCWEFSPTNKYPGGLDTWKRVFKPMKAINFGISGDRTEHVLWRITEGKNLDGSNPKLIVLLIGTNNLHRKGKPDTPEQVAEGIKLIIKTIQEKLPKTKILLLGVLPRGFNATDGYRKKIIKLNSIISAYADRKKVFYLDIAKNLLNKDGSVTREILRDGLHLSPKGYDVMANAILPQIKDLTATKED